MRLPTVVSLGFGVAGEICPGGGGDLLLVNLPFLDLLNVVYQEDLGLGPAHRQLDQGLGKAMDGTEASEDNPLNARS